MQWLENFINSRSGSTVITLENCKEFAVFVFDNDTVESEA